MVKRSLLVVAVACAMAHAAIAQTLQGTVRDSASGLGIPGAVLVLLDSSGNLLGRNITNERGDYVIALTHSMRTLQVLRIGFRPRIRPIPEPVDGVARLDLTMVRIPTLLTPVRVIDQPNCPRRNDRAAAFALWEQAQAALLATIVAREANPAQVVRLRFDRRMVGLTDSTDHLWVRVDSASTTRPFISLHSAADFITRGFVEDSSGITTFHAPDADVLLDPAFTSGYCLEMAAPDPSRRTEVGLAFRAARSKRDRIDIAGTVWIDSASRSLTDLVFRYVGLPRPLDAARPGGQISFRTMVNGSVIIDRWFVRLMGQSTIDPTWQGLPRSSDIREVHEQGGEVAHARWPDGHEWAASLGILRGRAMYDTGPATNVRLSLLDTDYRAATDSLGDFMIPHLVPGPYTLGVIDPALEEIDLILRTGVGFRARRDTVVRATFNAPTAQTFARTLCAQRVPEPTGHAIIGRAMTSSRGLARANYRAETGERTTNGQTDAAGVFLVCGVKWHELWQITARSGSLKTTDSRMIERPVEIVKLELRPPTP